ncbi:MAG: hypothetical protein QXP01_08520, partial [Candidatus Hadarchaeum sp.]
LPEAEEVLGSLIYTVVYSSLLFYWLPLLLSLTSLTERIYPAQITAAKVVFLCSWLLLLLLFGVLYKSRSVRQQWRNIQNAARCSNPKARRLRRLIWWRMRGGQWLTAGNFLVILGLYSFHLLRGGEEGLQIWAMVNIGMGVTLGLIDLALLRPDNVFFTNLDRLVEQLESQAREIRDLMETLSKKMEAIQPFLSEEIYADLNRRYELLRSQIPKGRISLPLVQEFRELGPIVSLAEIKGYSQGLSLLQEGVKDLVGRVEQAKGLLARQPT